MWSGVNIISTKIIQFSPFTMPRLTFYILFGATFLPGFLSDPFDPRTAYSVENPMSIYDDGIISHDIVPLKIREKRQAPISLPPSPSSSPQSTPQPNKAIILPTLGGDGSNLLRSPANVFTPNNATDQKVPVTTLSPQEEEDNEPDFPAPQVNYTEYATNHNKTEKTDNFVYYRVSYKPPTPTLDQDYWIDLSKTKHDMLSNAHRRAATLKPKFEFPFYGHNVTNLTIATGGFIYLGAQVHAWLAATQYVAPLMANFDSSTSPNSTVSYLSTDTFFTVEWSQLKLHDSPTIGNFTFQATLHQNGTIVFAYKNIPIEIKNINDTQHPVKVGLSDAYIRDKSILVIKQKTIYEYHRVDLKDKGYDVLNGSAIIFEPQQTCLSFKTCETCTAENGTDFDCAWCPKLNKCSSGMDRNRQDWILAGCDKDEVHIQLPSKCPSLITYNITDPNSPSSSRHDLDHEDLDHDHDHDHDDHNFPDQRQDKYKPETSQVQKSKTSESSTTAGGVIGIMFFIVVIFASVGWVAYAYLYPHTPSGQLLIRYRPSTWAGFRRGEARYTAASIHM